MNDKRTIQLRPTFPIRASARRRDNQGAVGSARPLSHTKATRKEKYDEND